MSPFANSLAGKVKDLEEKVANITGDIVKLQDGQNETRRFPRQSGSNMDVPMFLQTCHGMSAVTGK